VNLDLDLQIVCEAQANPEPAHVDRWIREALAERDFDQAVVVVRIVDEAESEELNHAYRHKDSPTNVLSFPFEPPPGIPADELDGYLGDLVICAPVVAREAAEQGKTTDAHWAHLVIHGVLHLLGYDHQNDAEAAEMEGREREILARLGFPDPYSNNRDQ